MKFIVLNRGTVQHIQNGIKLDAFAFCGKWAYENVGDKTYKNSTGKPLCKHCKRIYLKDHTEEDLMLEML